MTKGIRLSKYTAFSASLLLLWTSVAYAIHFDIDPSKSSVEFKIKNSSEGNVSGQVYYLSGQFIHSKENPMANTYLMKFRGENAMSSNISSMKFVRSTSVFDVRNNPEATLKSIRYMGSINKGTLEGELTFRGKKKNVLMKMQKQSEEMDYKGPDRITLKGKMTFKLQDFGSLDKGTIELTFNIDGNRLEESDDNHSH